MKEQDLTNCILDWLTFQGVFAWQNHTHGIYDVKTGKWRKRNSKYALSGVPDILGILHDGKFLGIEVKVPKNKNGLSPEQKFFISKAITTKGVCFMATSIEDCINHLSSFGYKITPTLI